MDVVPAAAGTDESSPSNDDTPRNGGSAKAAAADLNTCVAVDIGTAGGGRQDADATVVGEEEEQIVCCGRRLSKERVGWYMFDWANSPIYTVALALFLPILVKSMAEDYAYGSSLQSCSDDAMCGRNGCDTPATCTACVPGRGILEWVGSEGAYREIEQKGVEFLGVEIQAISFATTMISVSVVAQVFVFITFGRYGDFGRWRKNLMIIFTLIGALPCIGIVFLDRPSLYWLGGVFLITINVGLGSSIVFYNAFLPILVELHPKVRRAEPSAHEGRDQHPQLDQPATAAATDFTGLLTRSLTEKGSGAMAERVREACEPRACRSHEGTPRRSYVSASPSFELVSRSLGGLFSPGRRWRDANKGKADDGDTSTEQGSFELELEKRRKAFRTPQLTQEVLEVMRRAEDVSNEMSTLGIAIGNAGAFLCLVGAAALQFAATNDDNGRLADRLSTALSGLWWLCFSVPTFMWLRAHRGPPLKGAGGWVWLMGWKGTWEIICQARMYDQVLMMLLCFYFYSDSYNTIASVGVLVAQSELCLSSVALLFIIFLILICANLGGIFFLWLQRRLKLSTKSMVLVVLTIYLFIALWGSLGVVPGSTVGFKNPWEAYLFGVLHGFGLGAVVSFSRALYAEFLPPGKEAEFFALYAVTDRGSSWMGPLVTAVLYQTTGEMRWIFLYLLVMVALPMVLLFFFVNQRKGELAAGRLEAVRQAISKPDAAAPAAKTATSC